MRNLWNLYTQSQKTYKAPSEIMGIAGWVQRQYPGHDGAWESYAFDNAVTFVGGFIEGLLYKYDEIPQGIGKGTKREPRYKNIREIFDIIEGRKKLKSRSQLSLDALKAAGLVFKNG